MILFLKPALTIAVEAWTSWGLFTKWFVQRDDGDDIRAIAEEISLAETDAQRNSLDVPLATLLSQIRTAAATRTARVATSDTDTDSGSAARSGSDESLTTMTTVAGILRPEGGLGREKPVPVLITDANRLRDAYVEFGAIYEGEGATTVLPPPPPEPPGVPTKVGMWRRLRMVWFLLPGMSRSRVGMWRSIVSGCCPSGRFPIGWGPLPSLAGAWGFG